jgi:hypothetical protein
MHERSLSSNDRERPLSLAPRLLRAKPHATAQRTFKRVPDSRARLSNLAARAQKRLVEFIGQKSKSFTIDDDWNMKELVHEYVGKELWGKAIDYTFEKDAKGKFEKIGDVVDYSA